MELRVQKVAESGPFDFRWPQSLEHFQSGWEGIVDTEGRRLRLLHGLGGRVVYGGWRPHTVTFLDTQPAVEGVAADDYEQSRCLLRLIKPGAGHTLAKEPANVPPEYRDFEIVEHSDEIRAPYTKHCLAVKIREDDLHSWALHAVRRHIAQGRI